MLLLSATMSADPVLSKQPSKNANTVDPAVENYKKGSEQFKLQDYDGAIDSLLQAVYFARNNYHPDAYYLLGMSYKAKNQDTKATDAFSKHLEQTVKPSPDARVELGEVYMRNSRDREAEREFQLALVDYRGAAPRAHNALGKLYDKKKDYQTAQWHYEQALGDQPWQYADAWTNYAENMMIQQQWASAVLQFQAMLDRGKSLKGLDAPRVCLDLGVAKYAKGDHQGALEAWQTAITVNPSYPAPHLLLAKMFEEEKHISSAIKEYRAYIGLATNDPQLPQIKTHLLTLEQKIRPAEAEMQPVQPSPYTRKQIENSQRASQQQMQQQMDNLSSPDAGF